MDRARECIPAFDAAYPTWLMSPLKAEVDEMLTTTPPPAATMCGSAKCAQRKAPRRFTAMVRSHTATGVVSASLSWPSISRPKAAALLTRMSSRPKRSTVAATIRATSSSSATSPAIGSAAGPSRSAAERAPAALMSKTVTPAPSAVSASAVANPIPCAAPVMTAAFPLSRLMRTPVQRTVRRRPQTRPRCRRPTPRR